MVNLRHEPLEEMLARLHRPDQAREGDGARDKIPSVDLPAEGQPSSNGVQKESCCG